MQWITKEHKFPPVENATEDGLLALGGDLSVERLLLAYNSGIFPWFNDDSLIMWWSPDPRLVLYPKKIKISKSMRKLLASRRFRLTKNTCFDRVMHLCGKVKRKDQEGTWITPKMKTAYRQMHDAQHAVSYEVWEGKELVGGLYGIDLGHFFCGESMFSLTSNASKFALIHLARELEQKEYVMIDCQVPTTHLESMGAERVSREKFISMLQG